MTGHPQRINATLSNEVVLLMFQASQTLHLRGFSELFLGRKVVAQSVSNAARPRPTHHCCPS